MKQEQPPQPTQSPQSFIINSKTLEYCGLKPTTTLNNFTAPFLLGTTAVINYLRTFHEQQLERLSCSILLFNDYKFLEKKYSLIKIESVITKVNSNLKKQVLTKVMRDVKETHKGYYDTIIFHQDKIQVKLGSLGYYSITLTTTPLAQEPEEPEFNLWLD